MCVPTTSTWVVMIRVLHYRFQLRFVEATRRGVNWDGTQLTLLRQHSNSTFKKASHECIRHSLGGLWLVLHREVPTILDWLRIVIGFDVLHYMSLLLPEIIELLILYLTLEKQHIDGWQIAQISIPLELLTDLRSYSGDWQLHLIKVDHIRYLQQLHQLWRSRTK